MQTITHSTITPLKSREATLTHLTSLPTAILYFAALSNAAISHHNTTHHAVTGSCDSLAKVWDVRTGKCTMTLRGHESDINSVTLFPDGKVRTHSSYTDRMYISHTRNVHHLYEAVIYSSHTHSHHWHYRHHWSRACFYTADCVLSILPMLRIA